jgi:hypothetical protein
MSKIYLQNPEKTQIQVFENENQIGFSFISWVNLTEGEIVKYELGKEKQEKLCEVDKFKKATLYAPLEYKNFILLATEKAQNNIVGALVSSFDKKQWIDIRGNDIELSRSEFEEIRDIIEKRSYLCYRAEADLINKISIAKDIAEFAKIDIEKEFAKINKIILVA